MTEEHHLDDDDDLLCVLLERKEALLHQFSVLAEVLRPIAAEDLDLLRRQLERSLFELDALSWRIRQEEAEVDVHDVALDVDHDVAVVPVLDLENVAYERIGSQRLAEVLTRGLVGLATRGAELVAEVVDDAYLLSSELFFDAGDAQRIVAYFD